MNYYNKTICKTITKNSCKKNLFVKLENEADMLFLEKYLKKLFIYRILIKFQYLINEIYGVFLKIIINTLFFVYSAILIF